MYKTKSLLVAHYFRKEITSDEVTVRSNEVKVASNEVTILCPAMTFGTRVLGGGGEGGGGGVLPTQTSYIQL
jgi:hypothetical protein